MRFEQKIHYASLTDVGFRRRMNQDAFAARVCPDRETFEGHGHLFLVADGMGGHAVGELASKIAAETVPHVFFKSGSGSPAEALRAAITAANAAIHERGSTNSDFHNMGTTCTAAVLGPGGLTIGHVGDSRVYRVRDGRIEQLTFDHSLQWELIRKGQMSPEEVMLHQPRNVITRSLGPSPQTQIDLEGPLPVASGDVYVLCSDGLCTHVEDAEIGAVAGHLPPAESCRLLVHMANLRGGADNITVVVVRVGDSPSRPVFDMTSPAARGLTWPWLLTMWTTAMLFVAGLCATLLNRPLLGSSLFSAVAVLAGVGLLIALRRRHHAPEHVGPSGGGPGTPYRTAAAPLTTGFISRLSAMDNHLHRTADDEGWRIDWPNHKAAAERAQALLARGRLHEALAETAHALDLLMSGIHQARRKRRQRETWTTSSSSAPMAQTLPAPMTRPAVSQQEGPDGVR